MVLAVKQLVEMSQEQLDDLFRNSSISSIPSGECEGTMIIDPGTGVSEEIAQFIHDVIWKGKIFYPEAGELRNRMVPLDIVAFVAKVYIAKSWFDGKEAMIVDYSQTSLVGRWARDEFREVGPGLYLGVVYWDHHRLMNIALSFPVPNV